VTFQLLARPQDRLVDVKLGDRRVTEARHGFFFPEQRDQALAVSGHRILARDVPVHVVDLTVPRLRRLLTEQDLRTYTSAVAAGQAAVESVPAVTVQLAFKERHAWLAGRPLDLPEAEFVWFSALALACVSGRNDGWLENPDLATPREAILRLKKGFDPRWEPGSDVWKAILRGLPPGKALTRAEQQALSAIRSKCKARVLAAAKVLKLQHRGRGFCLVEEVVKGGKKFTRWRLPVEPSRITLADTEAELLAAGLVPRR
jgi:hypothetical protein